MGFATLDMVLVYGLFLPFALTWTLVFLSPVLLVLLGAAISICGFLHRALTPNAQARQRLREFLDGLSQRLSGATQVCACAKETENKTYLSVYLRTEKGAQSHFAKANGMSGAVARMLYKLDHSGSGAKDFGRTVCQYSMGQIPVCMMRAHCPNNVAAKNRMKEIYRFKPALS